MYIIPTNTVQKIVSNGCFSRLLTSKQCVIKDAAQIKYKPVMDIFTKNAGKSYAKISGLRSMQNIKGIEREIIEEYREELPHEIWGDAEKLKQWAYKKTEELATTEYPSALLDDITIRTGRTDAVDNWYRLVKQNYLTRNNPFLQLKIIKFVTSNLLTDNKQLAPILNDTVFTDAVIQMKNTGVSFKKTYYRLMRELKEAINVITEDVNENGIIGKWYLIKVPEEEEAKKNLLKFNKIKNFIAILSQRSNWCTRNPQTVGREFANCTFNIFIDSKGVPQICMTSMGSSNSWFEYVRGNDQYAPIKDIYKSIIKSFLNRHEIYNGKVGYIDGIMPINEIL